MKLTLVAAALALLARPLAAGDAAPLAVAGVHLHDTSDTVVKRLGKPLRRETYNGGGDIGMGELEELVYRGLKVGLNRAKGEPAFTVQEMHVTSRRYTLSNGIAVGMGLDAVRERLGPGVSAFGDRQLEYPLVDERGKLLVTFEDGKATLIEVTAAPPREK